MAVQDRGLAQIELLRELEPELLRAIEKQCRWLRVSANEHILERESDNRDVFFVVEGAVRVVNYSSSGREIAFANVREGGYFGEIAAIDGEPRTATVIATEKCRLASLSPHVFQRILREDPQVAFKVLRRLTKIIRACDDRIMDLSTLRAVNRVYVELVRLAEPDIVAPGNWVVRPMRTHAEIASRVSTTRETVARVMGHLTAGGIVERKGKTLYIRDRGRLEALARAGTEESDEILPS